MCAATERPRSMKPTGSRRYAKPLPTQEPSMENDHYRYGLDSGSRSTRPKGNQTIRHRRQAVRLWIMHRDNGMTVRQIAEAVGRTEKQVSAMLVIGKRFY